MNFSTTRLLARFGLLFAFLGLAFNSYGQTASLPLTFEDTTVAYAPAGFGSKSFAAIPTAVIANPDPSGNPSTMVWNITKEDSAQVWAGASIDLGTSIDLSTGPNFSFMAWSPKAGATIRLKFEDLSDPAIFAEGDASITAANTWEMLTIDMSVLPGWDPTKTYGRVVIFPDFGVMGGTTSADYYFDNVMNTPTPINLPLTFEDTSASYAPAGFGSKTFGAIATAIIANPDPSGNGSGYVWNITKEDSAQVWAGASIDLSSNIDLSNGPMFSIMAWSPKAGATIRLKFEDLADPAIFAEGDASITAANTWEMLTFDMSTLPGWDPTKNYGRVVIFPDFGVMGGMTSADYYFDDVMNAAPMAAPIMLPLTFEDTALNYAPAGFGSKTFAAIPTAVIANPDPNGNLSGYVWNITKADSAQVWAGASIDLGSSIDLSNGPMFSIMAWSPKAGATIRLKFEDLADPAIFAEGDASITAANTWEMLTFDMSTLPGWDPTKNYGRVVIFPDFGVMGGMTAADYYFDDVMNAAPMAAPIEMPLTFEDTALNYAPAGFGSKSFGAIATAVIANPDPNGNASGYVWNITKEDSAQVWAGASIDLSSNIDLSNGPMFSIMAWSPKAGATIRLKFEDLADPAIFAEGDASITAANTWEMLTFDMSTLPGWDPTKNYGRVVIFPDFGVMGGMTSADYYFDDVMNAAPMAPPIEMPLTFEDTALNYAPAGFGSKSFGAIATAIIANPDPNGNGSGYVWNITKEDSAQVWAGASIDLTSSIDLANGPMFSVMAWSPKAGATIRLKFEDLADPAIFAEGDASITAANTWEMLTFDMSTLPGWDPTKSYGRVVIFPDFGVMGGMTSADYYFDDVMNAAAMVDPIEMPLTFEDTAVAHNPVGFGSSTFGPIPTAVVANPDPNGNGSGYVWNITKEDSAQVWAGASIDLTSSIDLSNGPMFSVMAWSPKAGATIRLKFEDLGDPAIFAEGDATVSTANTWEMLTFDMSTLPGWDPNHSYGKVVIFPDFGVDGGMTSTDYYFDNVMNAAAPMGPEIQLPLTFEDTITYTLFGFGAADFGPIPTDIIANPDSSDGNPSDRVWSITKTAEAQVWAGTTLPLTSVIDLSSGPKFSVNVWSPKAGATIRLKLEDTTSPPDGNGNPTIIAEADATVANASTWEVLEFDMTLLNGWDQSNNYNQVIIFPDYGVMGDTVDVTYYFDDVKKIAGSAGPIIEMPLTFEDTTLSYNPQGFGAADFSAIPTAIIDNPDQSGNPSDRVWNITKTDGAQVWAGATVKLGSDIDLNAGTTFYVNVWSPRSGVTIMLKLEDTSSPPDGNGNPSIFSEVQATTTVANAWETLSFDMTTFGGFDINHEYDQVVMFPDFGQIGATGGEDYYFDNVNNDGSVGLEDDLFQGLEFTLYPNPTQNLINVRFGVPEAGEVRMSVKDMTGRNVFVGSTEQAFTGTFTKQFDVNELPAGAYLIMMEWNGTVVQTAKFVKRN